MSNFSAVVIADGDASGNVTSEWINIRTFACFSIHFWFGATDTATGSVSFEVSCEDNPTIATRSGETIISRYVTHPVTLSATGLPIAITAGAPATSLVNFVDQGYKWIRLVYTRTSGIGTLNARMTAKAGIP